LRRRYIVDHLLAEPESGPLSPDVDQQRAEPRIGPGQDLVHEREVEGCHAGAPEQDRGEHLIHADPAGLRGSDLIVCGKVAEGVEHGQQHRHGKGHGDDERQAQEKHLSDDGPGQSLAHEGAEFLGDLAQEHEAGLGSQGKKEGGCQLPDDVAVQQAQVS
jgi:hypothetical protein